MEDSKQSSAAGFVPATGRSGNSHSARLLVGRDTALASLQAAFDQAAASRETCTVTLIGETGIGKSALAAAFLDRLARRGFPHTLLAASGSPPAGPEHVTSLPFALLPFALLRDLLVSHFGIQERASRLHAREKLQNSVVHLLGPDGVERARWIARLAGCEFEHSPYPGGRFDEPHHARQAAFQALNCYLCAAAQQAPLIILLEDLQWADEASLEWLDLLASSGVTGPLLIVAIARPSMLARRPDWGTGWLRHTQLPLGPLADEDAAWLARELLLTRFSQDVPLVLAHRIARRSGGCPLMVEELVRLVLKKTPPGQKDLALTEQPALAELPAVVERLPGSLASALRLRLERLPTAEQEALRRAAVIGPVFWQEALALLDVDGAPQGAGAEPALSHLLARLEDSGWIQRRASSAFPDTAEFTFRSALLYEVLSAGLEDAPRRAAHAAAASWLAARSDKRAERFTLEIARHYEQAGAASLAAEWYGLAAQHARKNAAPEAAVVFFRRALYLLPENEAFYHQRVQLYQGLWDAQWWLAHYPEALETSQCMRAAAEQQGDRVTQAAAWNRIAAVQNRQADYAAALRSVQRAERLARAGGAVREVVLALFNRGVTLYRLGDAAAALEAGEQALAFNKTIVAKDDGSTDMEFSALAGLRAGTAADARPAEKSERESARILTLLGMIHQRAGRYEQAEGDYRKVLEIHRQRDDTAGMIPMFYSLGQNAYLKGDFRAAVTFFEQALGLIREIGHHQQELACLNSLAGAQVELGKHIQAENGLRDVIRRAPPGWPMLPETYRWLALAYLGQRRYDEALSAGIKALHQAAHQEMGSHQEVGRAWRTLGRIAACFRGPVMIDNAPCTAHGCYAASLQVFVELGAAGEQARTARQWAAYELEQGDYHEGMRLWEEARELFARLGMPGEVERMNRVPTNG